MKYLVMFLGLLMVSCTSESSNPFVGEWEVVKGNMAGGWYTFEPDGTLLSDGKAEGRYVIQENGEAQVLRSNDTWAAYPPVNGEMRMEPWSYRGVEVNTLRPYEELPITNENLVGNWVPAPDAFMTIGSGHPLEITFGPEGVISSKPQCVQDEQVGKFRCSLLGAIDNPLLAVEVTRLTRHFLFLTTPATQETYRYVRK